MSRRLLFNASFSPVPRGDYGTVTASWSPELEWPDRWNLTLRPLHVTWALETGGRWAFWFPDRYVENYLGVLWSLLLLLLCVYTCMFSLVLWDCHMYYLAIFTSTLHPPSVLSIQLCSSNKTKPSRRICATQNLVCEIFHCSVVSLPGATLHEKAGPFFLSSYQLDFHQQGYDCVPSSLSILKFVLSRVCMSLGCAVTSIVSVCVQLPWCIRCFLVFIHNFRLFIKSLHPLFWSLSLGWMVWYICVHAYMYVCTHTSWELYSILVSAHHTVQLRVYVNHHLLPIAASQMMVERHIDLWL